MIGNGIVVTDEMIPNAMVLVKDGRILSVGSQLPQTEISQRFNSETFEFIDAEGGLIVPGLLDVHIHGSNGFELTDGTDEAIRTIAGYVGVAEQRYLSS